MARVAFLGELGRLGVSAIQVEPDELEQDLAAAEAAACDHPHSHVLHLAAGLGGLDILPSLYGRVVVPVEVIRELESGACALDSPRSGLDRVLRVGEHPRSP